MSICKDFADRIKALSELDGDEVKAEVMNCNDENSALSARSPAHRERALDLRSEPTSKEIIIDLMSQIRLLKIASIGASIGAAVAMLALILNAINSGAFSLPEVILAFMAGLTAFDLVDSSLKLMAKAGGDLPIGKRDFDAYRETLRESVSGGTPGRPVFSSEVIDYIGKMTKSGRSTPTINEMRAFVANMSISQETQGASNDK